MSAFKITTIKAFIATAEDGSEGIISMKIGNTFLPFVCADDRRLEDLIPKAKEISKQTGKKVTLACFSLREDIENYN